VKKLNDVKARIISFESILSTSTGNFFKVLIPTFQREYRWSARQVRSFVRDAHRNFEQGAMTYFGGTTAYGAEGFESSTLNVVDGQQRITTTYLMLCAGSSLLPNTKEYKDLRDRIDDCLFTKTNQGKKNYRLVSQHAAANSVIQDIADGTVPSGPLSDPAANYARAFEILTEEIGKLLPGFSDLAKFLNHFLDEAGVSMVMADEANATSIFVKQHSTMTPLDIVDQAKGVLFDDTLPNDRGALATEFHKVQSVLWAMGGPPERHFTQILRGVFPNEGRSASALLTNLSEAAGSSTPLKYVTEHLLPAATALYQGVNGRHPDGALCQSLNDIKEIPRLSRFRGIRPIIVAARAASKADRDEIMTALRDTLVVLAVAKNHPPDNEMFFVKCAELVNDGETRTAVSAMKHHRDALAQEFSSAFHALRYDEFGHKGIRMLLNAAECAVRSAHKLTFNNTLLDLLTAANYQVEHVLPQDVASWPAWNDVNDPSDVCHRIGNLTMLLGGTNGSLKNKPYSVKRDGLVLSEYYITKSIVTQISGHGVNNGAANADRLLLQFPVWDDIAIQRRTAMLYALVCRHLDVKTATPAVVEKAAPADFSQARPGNTLLVLRAIAQGSTTQSEIEEHLEQDDDKERSRQVAYCVKTLTFLGLIENLGEDECILTEAGGDVMMLPADKLELELSVRFKNTLLRIPGGAKLIEECRSSKGKSAAARIEAVRAMYPDMSATMLSHRAGSAKEWLTITPADNTNT
jgi:hypothetical protein